MIKKVSDSKLNKIFKAIDQVNIKKERLFYLLKDAGATELELSLLSHELNNTMGKIERILG